jgi:hypothetical protein
MSKQEVFVKAKAHITYHNAKGEKIPGVTTVLGELAKPALIHWAWDLGMKQIDYRTHRDILADVGTLAHYLIVCHLKGETVDASEYSAKQIDLAENCLLSYYEWARHHTIEPILIETPLVSEVHQFGGTLDFYGKIDGILTLMDFKTGKKIYDEHFYQLAALRVALIENDHAVGTSRILNIGRDETERFEEKQKGVLADEWEIFQAALTIYQAKKRIKKDND